MKVPHESMDVCRSLFDSMGDGFLIGELIRDESGHAANFFILDANSIAEKHTGLAREQLIGQRVTRAMPFCKPAFFERLDQVVRTGETARFEMRYAISGRWFETYACPLRDSNRLALTFRDITDRRLTEEGLRESEEEYRFLVENAGDVIWKIDIRGRWTFVSGKVEELTGYRPEEIIGRSVWDFLAPECHDNIRDKLQRRLSGEEIPPYEGVIIGKDGQRLPFEVLTAPIREDGRITGIQGVSRDISGRKQAENALRSSEARFRALFENASTAIFIVDAETGTVLDCNSNGEMLIGRSRDEIVRMNVLQLHPQDDLEKHCSNIMRMAAEGYIVNYECEALHRDGRRIPILINATPIVIDGRKIMMGSFLDITERKRAEDALRHSEERYRQLTENSADFIYIIDRDYRVQFVNRAGAEALGIPPESATGKGLDVLFPPDTFVRMKKGLDHVFETGRPRSAEMVHKFYRGDYYTHVVLTPLFDGDGKVSSVMGVSRDIDDLKKAEAAMRESEEKFRVLAETSPAAICVFREDEFVYVNPAVERISGYSREELFQTKMWNLLVPGCRDQLIERANARKQGEHVPSHYELSFVNKSGEAMWVDISLGPINIGGLPAYIVSAFDVTERKRAEKELMEAKAQAELYLDLLGHDINNMHQMALGYLEIARDAGTDEGQKVFLEKPIEVLQRSAQLIRNVRKLQKAREGSVSMQTVDLCTLLSDLCREYEALPDKSIFAEFNGHTHCYVRANELLYDVFSNLVGNAVRHTPDHTRISISLDSQEEGDKSWYTVSVSDDGQGIPDDFKGIIFDRSFKGTARKNGMGIGLYLVKTLVDSYHGTVWVEDRVPGSYTNGAKFVVRLPAVTK